MGGALVRQGDVEAAPSVGGEGGNPVGQLLRRAVDRAVLQRDPELPPEGLVDARRQRVGHGVADDGVAVCGHGDSCGGVAGPVPAVTLAV